MRFTTHGFWAVFLASLLTIALVPRQTDAVVIASTNFVDDEGDGTIDGDTSGIGWAADGWTVQDATLGGAIVPSDMSYLVPGGGLVSASSALQFTGSPLGSGVERQLADAQDGDDIYISFLTKWESGEVNGNDFVIWYFGTNGGPNIGYKANIGAGSEPDEAPDFVARTTGNTNQYAPDNLVVGDTYFVVGHLAKTAPGAGNPYDLYELWVNPGVNDFNTPEAVSEGPSNISEFQAVGVRTHQINAGGAEPDELLFGALTIGTTWADVVPGESDLVVGDFDGNGTVDAGDFQVLAANMYGHLDGVSGHDHGDINFDGRIDLNDFHQFVEDFPAGAAAQSVPEPSTCCLGIVSVLAFLQLMGRRRRRG